MDREGGRRYLGKYPFPHMQIGAGSAKVATIKSKPTAIEMKYTAEIKWVRGTHIAFAVAVALLTAFLYCVSYIFNNRQNANLQMSKMESDGRNGKQKQQTTDWAGERVKT